MWVLQQKLFSVTQGIILQRNKFEIIGKRVLTYRERFIFKKIKEYSFTKSHFDFTPKLRNFPVIQ